ncbi:MAG TPA: helix-turn-helix transcriptional regulator [Flavobacteriales bacterium]|nr:helix-turn-helix transcriptional regulator [Flavobacteriales bacterium]
MDIGATIGARIAFFRSLIGWNQKRLALEMGLDPSRISRIERGLAKPLFEEVERIGVLLGQPLANFDTMRPVQFTVAVVLHGAQAQGVARS